MGDKETNSSSERKPGDGNNSFISEQERDWAQGALTEFNRNNYAQCVMYVNKLEASRSTDIKVAHNKAVAEYYKSDLKKTDQFRKNINVVCAQAHVSIEDLDGLEDVELCVLYYNQAVILYHLKQYIAALKIMNKVFSFIEPMEESLAHRVCLLLVELHLCTQQPEKALSLIAYIENQFVSTENATKIMADKEMKSLEKEQSDKTVCLDAATEAFRLKLVQYRVRCYIETCAIKACKRDLKTILPSSGNQSLSPLFLKAHLEYQRGNFMKAITILNSLPKNLGNSLFRETGESSTMMYYNNLGCLHHYMGKPALSTHYFTRAIQENNSAVKSYPRPETGECLSGRPLHTVCGSRAPQLMYNFGVSLLHAGRPLQAFDCLMEAVQVYHMNPQLWLRLAECCVMANKLDNSEDFNYAKNRKELIQGIVASGHHRKILLNPDIFKNNKDYQKAQSFAIPVASLEFASLCLRNALFLLPPASVSASADDTAPTPASPPSSAALLAPPSPPQDALQVIRLRSTVLATSAYVSLCLGDPVSALEHASALIAQPNLSPTNRFLGHLYAGEALMQLDKLPRALDMMKMDVYGPEGVLVENKRRLKQWHPLNSNTAISVIQYNSAVALALSGRLDKAGQIVKQIFTNRLTNECSMKVVALAILIELQLGHGDVARNIVKRNYLIYEQAK